ncbi:hypothetical protein GS682_06820 [Nostoc sp. B(2019)]|nr:hypothetical protein [Nostoc sp. B(2019)]
MKVSDLKSDAPTDARSSLRDAMPVRMIASPFGRRALRYRCANRCLRQAKPTAVAAALTFRLVSEFYEQLIS